MKRKIDGQENCSDNSANRGLGAALAKSAHDRGMRVIGTARRIADLNGDRVDTPLELDLSDQGSIAKASAHLLALGQSIDLLVNNAGFNPKDRKDDPAYFQSTLDRKSVV